jgi:hypothetical protein
LIISAPISEFVVDSLDSLCLGCHSTKGPMMLGLFGEPSGRSEDHWEATPQQASSKARRKDNDMALSIAELELQTAEFLPAREVMSSCGGRPPKDHHDCGCDGDETRVNYQNGLLVVGVQNNGDIDIL